MGRTAVAEMVQWAAPIERLPPSSIDAEESALGSVLIDPAAYEQVDRLLTPADFYIVKNGWAWAAMQAIAGRGDPIDVVTLARELEAREQLGEAGGLAFIQHLVNVVPTAIHAEGYARIVKRASVRRGVLYLLSDAVQQVYDEETDEIEMLSRQIDGLNDLRFAALARLNRTTELMTTREIMTTLWPEPVWIVPEMMSAGLGWLSGKQKAGKSWLMMQLACAKASGGRMFDQTIAPGPVLYCALEDQPRRIRSRAERQLWPVDVDIDWMFNKTFQQEIGNLAEGGTDRLVYRIQQRGYHLVVIDTFNRAIGKYLKSGEINDSGVITRMLDRLQVAALELNAAVVIIDHHGKAISNEQGDPLNDMVGSIAKGGTADFAWSLYRERGKPNARLIISGRDVEDKDLMLSWDKQFCLWNYDGDGGALRITQRREDILRFLEAHGRSMLQTISDGVGQAKSHTSERLKDLVASGLVIKIEEGRNAWFEVSTA